MLPVESTPQRSGEMYAQVMGSSATSQTITALSEEPGFGGALNLVNDDTGRATTVVMWESESSARWPAPHFGGRLLNVYRASGRPA
jgi:hypothetical protein